MSLVASCSSHQIKTETNYEKADSIIQSSKATVIKSDSIDRRSEKAINKKITQTVFKIKTLENEIIIVKGALDQATKNPTVIRVVDTVYIERKKNFWGKEKTTVTINSDSTSVADTTFQNK